MLQTSKSGDGSVSSALDVAKVVHPELTAVHGLVSEPLPQVDNSCGSGEPSRNRIDAGLSNRIKRAERSGEPVPRLPAGQRWKRRLPQACW